MASYRLVLPTFFPKEHALVESLPRESRAGGIDGESGSPLGLDEIAAGGLIEAAAGRGAAVSAGRASHLEAEAGWGGIAERTRAGVGLGVVL